jgi:hypothetical protein
VCSNVRSVKVLLETFSCPRASRLCCVAHAFARHPRNGIYSWKGIEPLALLNLHEAECQYDKGDHPKGVSRTLVLEISRIAGYLSFLTRQRSVGSFARTLPSAVVRLSMLCNTKARLQYPVVVPYPPELFEIDRRSTSKGLNALNPRSVKCALRKGE